MRKVISCALVASFLSGCVMNPYSYSREFKSVTLGALAGAGVVLTWKAVKAVL